MNVTSRFMEEHVYSILAIDKEKKKNKPELPPKYITKSTDNNTEHIERGRTLGTQP